MRTVGGYEIIKRLAVGGMAELFLAQKSGIEGFRKQVVLKRILPELLDSEEFVRMFLDEARLAAQLEHPNIVQVHDFGRDGDSYFFVMEQVRGKDLRAVIKAAAGFGGIPLEHALAVVLGIAAGLHHAHERLDADGRSLKIVHRDVSPGNVLVSFDGDVKLVDFGIAKARARQTQTKVGALKGKVGYMSPEQVRGEPIDRRSDIFSLGILLYELTTGLRLFESSGGELQLLHMVATAEVTPPSQRVPGYPPALERIVLRALAREREARYATAEALQCDLEKLAHDEGLMLSSVRLRLFMRMLFPEGVPARLATEPVWDEPEMVARAATELEVTALAPIPDEPPAAARATTAAIRRKPPAEIVEEEAGPTALPASEPVTLARGTDAGAGTGRTAGRRRRAVNSIVIGMAAGVAIATAALITMREGGPEPAVAAASVSATAPAAAPIPPPPPPPPVATPAVPAADPSALASALTGAWLGVMKTLPAPAPSTHHHHTAPAPAHATEQAPEAPAETPEAPPAVDEGQKLDL